jgi:hypothetical protein
LLEPPHHSALLRMLNLPGRGTLLLRAAAGEGGATYTFMVAAALVEVTLLGPPLHVLACRARRGCIDLRPRRREGEPRP